MVDPGTVGAEIRMRLPGLPLQGKGAAAILDRKHIGETTTRKEIAGVCVLSEAMVVKRPGLGRFRDFSRGHFDRHRFDMANEIVPQVCRTAMQAPETPSPSSTGIPSTAAPTTSSAAGSTVQSQPRI